MKRAVIIGAGPAGLTAARELLRRSAEYEVTVLEQSDRVGGISRTVCHNGNRMDIGGHRFFSKDPRVRRWWADVLPDQGAPSLDDRLLGRACRLAQGGPDPEKADRVMLLRERVSRIYYNRRFFDYPLSLKPATFANMGLAATVKAGCGYLRGALCKRPERSLEDFYINRFGRPLYEMFFEGYTEKLWGRHPRDIAPDWGAQRVKGLSAGALIADAMRGALGRKRDAEQGETSLIDSFRYPKYGPGQLWEAVAAEIEAMGGTIIRNARAERLTVRDNRICQVTAARGGRAEAYPCDAVFSSMPLKDLTAGLNGVSDAVAAIAAGLPYRDFVTVGVLVDRLALKNGTKAPTLGNIIPDCWVYVQDAGVKLGRVQVFNNWSPYMVAQPEKTVWLGLEFFCEEGDAFWNLSEAACAEQGVRELKQIGFLDENCRVLDVHRERVPKAYPAYFDTYARLDELKAYLDTIENLYCIGRNGQHRYNNMDHSMQTAFAAADIELTGGRGRRAVWDVNTDTRYHEEASP